MSGVRGKLGVAWRRNVLVRMLVCESNSFGMTVGTVVRGKTDRARLLCSKRCYGWRVHYLQALFGASQEGVMLYMLCVI